VTVQASASPVASDDASMGYRLDSATVLSLPLATRDVASWYTLSCERGATATRRLHNDTASDYQGARGLVQQNAPVNGARADDERLPARWGM